MTAVQHWLHCRALGNWCVPLLTLMKLPVRFLSKPCGNLFVEHLVCTAVCSIDKNPERLSTHPYMHWVFISSFHAAQEQSLFSPGWSDRVFLSFSFSLGGSAGLFTDTNRKWVVWYERAARSAVWKDVMDASLLQYYNCVQIMCNCVDPVCVFWDTVFVFFLLTGDHPFVTLPFPVLMLIYTV